MLYIDKYSPKNYTKYFFHNREIEILKNMSADDCLPHIIFYGPSGSGKKTLISKLLELLYDKDVHKLNDSIYQVSGSSNSLTDVIIKQSNYHIVIEPNNNNFDRYLIQDIVKEYAKKIPLNIFSAKKKFKTVLINNVDNLSYYAQTSLRRTMEKYSTTCRFIMWCRSLSRVIEPIRSRCYCFRITAPQSSDLIKFIINISCEESIKISLKYCDELIKSSDGDIKKLLWLLQLKKFNIDPETSYEKKIKEIVNKLLMNDINLIIDIRLILYNIMITNISGTSIIKDITKQLFNHNDFYVQCKINIAEIAAKFEHNLIKGRREIKHLEAFIIALMVQCSTQKTIKL